MNVVRTIELSNQEFDRIFEQDDTKRQNVLIVSELNVKVGDLLDLYAQPKEDDNGWFHRDVAVVTHILPIEGTGMTCLSLKAKPDLSKDVHPSLLSKTIIEWEMPEKWVVE